MTNEEITQAVAELRVAIAGGDQEGAIDIAALLLGNVLNNFNDIAKSLATISQPRVTVTTDAIGPGPEFRS